MFIISFKTTAKKIFITFGAILLICVLGLAVSVLSESRTVEAHCALGNYSLSAEDNAERTNFIRQFGWDVDSNPIYNKTVIIPAEFDDVYKNYNNIQLSQGLDLAPYKGKKCDSYTYKINNYPYDGEVYANLLIYNGCVIGGDICSVKLDGFMCGFYGEQDGCYEKKDR